MIRLQQWRLFDWVLFLDALWLIAIGVITIWSVDVARGGDVANGKRQLFALAIGLVIFAVASFAAANFYRATAHWWYAAGILALVLVLIFGVPFVGLKVITLLVARLAVHVLLVPAPFTSTKNEESSIILCPIGFFK